MKTSATIAPPLANMNQPALFETDEGSARQQALYTLIAQQQFFEGLDPAHFKLLADSASEMRFEPGQAIFDEGSPANRFFLILEGKVVMESDAKEHGRIAIQTLGAVGNVAGQLAKIRGCKVIGSTGSMAKVKFLREECGFDIAFDYKTGPIIEQLQVEAPDGIDVYFDNVGGEALEAALAMLRPHGRIIACGGISGYNAETPRAGPANWFNITTKRLTMKGMIVTDSLVRRAEFEKEVGGYLQSGKLKNKETIVEGLDQAESAFIGLFTGNNTGKMVVKLV